MPVDLTVLAPAERAALALRGLYERYGYRQYRMSQFEEYSLYMDNKSFLESESVAVFTDLDGRLMALKPDVTLSIIKNTAATPEKSEKLYYIENVYRESRESNNFKEIPQMGLEYIGRIDDYGITEVVSLACRTLEAISGEYILEMSHMDFATGLLRSMDMSEDAYMHMLKLIRNKNADGIRKIGAAEDLGEQQTESLVELTRLYGPVEETISRAEKLAADESMRQAMDQLYDIWMGLCAMSAGDCSRVQLDLSMVNDIDYYNGIIFKGYIKDLPRNVLAGGQYDRAMAMFGKKAGALGFALYLNEIGRIKAGKAEYDIDAVLLYDEAEKTEDIAGAVMELAGRGLSVRAESVLPEGIRYRYLYELKDGVCAAADDKSAPPDPGSCSGSTAGSGSAAADCSGKGAE